MALSFVAFGLVPICATGSNFPVPNLSALSLVDGINGLHGLPAVTHGQYQRRSSLDSINPFIDSHGFY